jgi:hypothetical protein
MEEFTLAELGVFLGVVGGIVTSILLTIQKSKCEKIKCCGKECCDRKIKYKPNGELKNVASVEEPSPEP